MFDPVMMRARSAVMLGKAHTTVAADGHSVEMLATAGGGVDDVAGRIDVVTIVASVRLRSARLPE